MESQWPAVKARLSSHHHVRIDRLCIALERAKALELDPFAAVRVVPLDDPFDNSRHRHPQQNPARGPDQPQPSEPETPPPDPDDDGATGAVAVRRRSFDDLPWIAVLL